jgi:hypothetical protein
MIPPSMILLFRCLIGRCPPAELQAKSRPAGILRLPPSAGSPGVNPVATGTGDLGLLQRFQLFSILPQGLPSSVLRLPLLFCAHPVSAGTTRFAQGHEEHEGIRSYFPFLRALRALRGEPCFFSFSEYREIGIGVHAKQDPKTRRIGHRNKN